LGARLEAEGLPISDELRAYCATISARPEDFAMRGGEDYELLFTAAPEDEDAIRDACTQAGTPVSRIGVVTPGPHVEIFLPDGTVEEVPTGFEHFPG
jgi:thiamine-monophosphate kinase